MSAAALVTANMLDDIAAVKAAMQTHSKLESTPARQAVQQLLPLPTTTHVHALVVGISQLIMANPLLAHCQNVDEMMPQQLSNFPLQALLQP